MGQMYNGEIVKGLVFLVAAGICLALTAVSVGLFLLLPLLPLWGWSIYDAYQTAARMNKTTGTA